LTPKGLRGTKIFQKILVISPGWGKYVFWCEAAGKVLKLIEVENPLVQDPLGTLDDRAASVKAPLLSVTFPVQVIPECC